MSKYSPRTTAPAKNSKYYYSDINPWYKKGIGTCTQYAQGRALELQDKSGAKMVAYNDTWYPIDMYNRCSEIGGTKSKTPNEQGCLIVWKQTNGSGSHIASVEVVTDQGNIYVSQMNSKNEFSYYKILKADNFAIDGYTLVGFVNLNLKWEASTSTKTVYRVQIGAFRLKSNAKKMAAEARKKGLQVIGKYYKPYYKVQVGAYYKQSNAENMLKTCRELGYKDAFITTEDGKDVSL